MKMKKRIFYNPEKYDYGKIVECLNFLTNCIEDEDCFYKDIFKSEHPISSLGILRGRIKEVILYIYFPCEENDDCNSYIEVFYNEEDKEQVNVILKMFEWLEYKF